MKLRLPLFLAAALLASLSNFSVSQDFTATTNSTEFFLRNCEEKLLHGEGEDEEQWLLSATLSGLGGITPYDLIPDGSNISTYINTDGIYDLELEGNAIWTNEVYINTAAKAGLVIDGQGNTIVASANVALLRDFTINNNTVYINNVTFTRTADLTTAGTYIIGFETSNVTSYLNLENTVFEGFGRTVNRGGVIYAYGSNSNITIDGGTAGVTFRGNRATNDAAGAFAVGYSTVVFQGLVNFDGNWTGSYGGAVVAYEHTNSLTFAGTTNFTGNHCVVFGGAVNLWGGGATINFDGPTTFTGNYVFYESGTSLETPAHVTDQNPRGGAANLGYTGANSNGTNLTFNGPATFSGNYVVCTVTNRNSLGGAISVSGNGSLQLYRLIFNDAAIFDGNYVYSASGVGQGGAIYYHSSVSNLIIPSGSQFTNNYAQTLGGGIYLQAGSLTLNAETADILFQGNRQGVEFDASYRPIAGTGIPNAVYMATTGSVYFHAENGMMIRMYDPISTGGGTIAVTKTGAGEIIIYGDSGTSNLYDWNLQATTVVQGGIFTLEDGVIYGTTTAGTMTTQGTATLQGGNNSTLRALSIIVQTDANLKVTAGNFTLDSPSITMQGGSIIRGSGTLTATSNINLGGEVAAFIGDGLTLTVNAVLGGTTGSLRVQSTGTLALDQAAAYTGTTTIAAGTLATNVVNAISASSSVVMESAGTLSLNNNNQIANNLSGTGNISLGNAQLNIVGTSDTAFVGTIIGTGSILKTGGGTLTLSGASTYTGGTTISEGLLIVTEGSALGTGAVDNATGLELAFADDSTMVNQLTGTGTVNKTGAGTATLTGANSSVGSMTVSSGQVSLAQNGLFTASSYTTASGATTQIGSNSRLAVTGLFSQAGGSNLIVYAGSGNDPAISSATATVSGSLDVYGYNTLAPAKASELDTSRFTVISTTGGIEGNFTSVVFDGGSPTVDYVTMTGRFSDDRLTYSVGQELTWFAGPIYGSGVFTLTNAEDTFEVDVELSDQVASDTGWNGMDLTKEGEGTLILSEQNTYTGDTLINGGTLSTQIADAFATSSTVTVAAGATLSLNNFAQTTRNLQGGGTISLGSAILTASNNEASTFSGTITGTGSLVKTGNAAFTVSGSSNYSGGTTVSEGRLIMTGTSSLGTGEIISNAELELAINGAATLGNRLGGTGNIYKTGSGNLTLTNTSSSVGGMFIQGGALTLQQNGAFTAASLNTGSGASLVLGANSKLLVTNNFTQSGGATLSIDAASGNGPAITARTANLSGSLTVSNFNPVMSSTASGLSQGRYVVLTTEEGITDDFTSVNLGSVSSTVDYVSVTGGITEDGLSYDIGFGLTWFAGPVTGDGAFTLTNESDVFTVDVVLSDQDASNTGWNGMDLIKEGEGTLILSAVNTYTGATLINEGTLSAGIENAFAASSNVNLAANSNLVLNDNNQTIRNLTGGGSINLGSADLTLINTETGIFEGAITGTGSLIKTGAASLTLSGTNNYSGGTTISEGTLIATSVGAIGSGDIANDAVLNMEITDNETLSNQLSGSGTLQKSGNGTLTLNNAQSTTGSVDVQAGTLSFTQNGIFQSGAYTTRSGAATILGSTSRLNLTGVFNQVTGSSLTVNAGSSMDAYITAARAELSGGLTVTGFTPTASGKASEIEDDRLVIISTTSGINGDFTSVNLGSLNSPVDYLVVTGAVSSDGLNYGVGFGLTWFAGTTYGDGVFTLEEPADTFEVDIVLSDQQGSSTGWNGRDLTKGGEGTLVLSEVNTYTGETLVNEGMLSLDAVDSIAASTAVTVESGAVLNMNGNQVLQNLMGGGTIVLGDFQITARNSQTTAFSGIISGNGSLVKTGNSSLTLSGVNTYAGGTTISEGTLTGTNVSALGTGGINITSSLILNIVSDGSMANAFSGAGSLEKTGSGTLTLTYATSQAGAVTVSAGSLALTQNGVFRASSFTTSNGASTVIGSNLSRAVTNSTLNVTNAFIQDSGSSLSLYLGEDNIPIITAGSADLEGSLTVNGYTPSVASSASGLEEARIIIITTTGGIEGNFSSLVFDSATTSPADYLTLNGRVDSDGLTYSLGLDLTWFAGTDYGNGVFTLAESSDTFNVDVVLSDQEGSATGWDGKSLNKKGAGTLILSAANTYTGATTIEEGTLSTEISGAFAKSSSLTMAGGTRLILNNNDQTAANLSGSGTILLGSAELTLSNTFNTAFGGSINGTGSIVKSGTGTLTLLGTNTYEGGTTITGGRLVAIGTASIGNGNITDNAELELQISADSTLSALLSGTGSVEKTGIGNLTLMNAGSSIGSVMVSTGTLTLGQSGTFTAGAYSTATGATTVLGGNAFLNINGEFIQSTGSILTVNLGASGNASITAESARIAGQLNVNGFSAEAPVRASDLEDMLFTVISTVDGIDGEFTSVNFGTSTSPADYLVLYSGLSSDGLNYNVGLELAWLAGPDLGSGTFTLPDTENTFNVDVILSDQESSATGWNGLDLAKKGEGTLILSAVNTYTGETLIDAGTLSAGAENVFALSSSVTVSSGATLQLNDFNQTARNLSGGGNIILGSGVLTVESSAITSFSGAITGSGSLIKTGTSDLTLTGNNTYRGGTVVSDGILIATNVTALGTGSVENNADLQLSISADGTMNNAFTGSGTINKTGTGNLTLTNAGSSVGIFTLTQGSLTLAQNGTFNAEDFSSLNTSSLTLGATSYLSVGSAFSLSGGSILNVTASQSDTPVISADTAILGGTLNVNGYTVSISQKASELAQSSYVVVSTTSGITGNFTEVNLGTAESTVDYLVLRGGISSDELQYLVGLSLAWFAGPEEGNGTFTLDNTEDSFEVDVVLSNQSPSETGWNGLDLTKEGQGTLILSSENTYTGATVISAGTLSAEIEDAFAASTSVSIASGATLTLNNYNQTAQNIMGEGSILLGTAILTLQNTNATTFDGTITGSGSLVKTGASTLTLTGENGFAGGATITEGRLVVTNAGGLGNGDIINNAQLELSFDGTWANKLTGSGTLFKSGAGNITLTNDSSSIGSVQLQGGTLTFSQNGTFTAGAYTTSAQSATVLGAGSTLNVTGLYTQVSGSSLTVTVGSADNPAITAGSADIAGDLIVSGFNAEAPSRASDLASTIFTVITTTGGITGDFDSLNLGSATNPTDYLLITGGVDADGLNYEIGLSLAWFAGTELGNGTFTIDSGEFDVDVALSDQQPSETGWNGISLTKEGEGTLTLSEENSYTGATFVNEGTLSLGVEDSIAASTSVYIGDLSTLLLNNNDQTLQNLSGAGTLSLGSAGLTLQNSGNTTYGGIITGSGTLTKTGAGTLTLTGASTFTGGTLISAGTVIATNVGALGAGNIVNNAQLIWELDGDASLANRMTGTGTVQKTGDGILTLTNSQSNAGAFVVAGGTVSLAQNGAFTAGTYTTQGTAATVIGENSTLNVGTLFTQMSGSSLTVSIGMANNPAVTAANAIINGDLYITEFSSTSALKASELEDTQFTVIRTTGGITGVFDSIFFGTAESTEDYLIVLGSKSADNLSYNIGLELTWLAGDQLGNGIFTLADNTDRFEVDIVLENQSPSATGWNGMDLTKKGDGSLILSAENTYTGITSILGGTMQMGVEDAVAGSSAVVMGDGAVFSLNNYDQAIRNLSGQGTISLGSAALTINEGTATTFGGSISGSGNMIKTGAASLTLTGNSNYTGGTEINVGLLIATTGTALGTGTITNNAALELAMEADVTMANELTGSGTVTKTGDGNLGLTNAGSSVGDVIVSTGALSLQQNGTFRAATYKTRDGAETFIGSQALLNVQGTFTQQGGSILIVSLGDVNTASITADDAVIGGDLYVNGYDSIIPMKASELASTRYTVIATQTGITGDFDSVTFGTSRSPGEYVIANGAVSDNGLDYTVGLELTWNSGPATSNGTFDLLGESDIFEVDVVLADQEPSTTGWDGKSLTKGGQGTLILSAVNQYTGATLIDAGTVSLGVSNAIASSSNIVLEEGASLNFNNNDQSLNDVSGAGTINLGSGVMTAVNNEGTTYSGSIRGTGSVVKEGQGDLTLSGVSDYSGGTSINAGRVIATTGTALGVGTVDIGTELQLDFDNEATLANTLSGDGSLIKSGGALAVLTGTGSSVNNVDIQQGGLSLRQNGAFRVTNISTQSGSTLEIGSSSSLNAEGALVQVPGSTLVTSVNTGHDPLITASGAQIAGNLYVNGYAGGDTPLKASEVDGRRFTVLSTTGGISGDFDSVDFGTINGNEDYLIVNGQKTADSLDYTVGMQLAWFAGSVEGNGEFTLNNAGDSFDIDVILSDQSASSTGWNGRDLTKNGEGTLILSARNTYTGTTTVNDGSLKMGAENAFAGSSDIYVNKGAVLDLNGYDQNVANIDVSGTVLVGSAKLSIDPATFHTGSTISMAVSDQPDRIIATGAITLPESMNVIFTNDGTYSTSNPLSEVIVMRAESGYLWDDGANAGQVIANGTVFENWNLTIDPSILLFYSFDSVFLDYDGMTVKSYMEHKDENDLRLIADSRNSLAGAELLWEAGLQAPGSTLGSLLTCVMNKVESGDNAAATRMMAASVGSPYVSMLTSLQVAHRNQETQIRNRVMRDLIPNSAYRQGSDRPYYNCWVEGNGAYNKVDSSYHDAGMELNTWGGTVGFDVETTPDWFIGGAFSYLRGDLKSHETDSLKGDMDMFYVNLFARYRKDNWTHALIVTGGWGNIDSTRTVSYDCGFYQGKGKTDAQTWSALYEVSYDVFLNDHKTLILQPLVNGGIAWNKLDDFDETGAGNASLHVRDLDVLTGNISGGARLLGLMGKNGSGRDYVGELRAQAVQTIGQSRNTGHMSYAANPGFQQTVVAAREGGTALQIGGGLSLPLGLRGTIFAEANAEFRSHSTSAFGSVGYRLNF